MGLRIERQRHLLIAEDLDFGERKDVAIVASWSETLNSNAIANYGTSEQPILLATGRT